MAKPLKFHQTLNLPARSISHGKHPACNQEIRMIHMSIREYDRMRDRLWMMGWCPHAETSSFVVGTVKMWGEVVEHQFGYRAQFAKLNSLDTLYGEASLSRLRDRYGVA